MKNILIIVAVVIVIAIIGFVLNQPTQPAGENNINIAPNSNQVKTGNTNMADKEPTQPAQPSQPGKYVAYNSALLAEADQGDVVLFFHAGWCPTCRALENSLGREANNIPSDLSILKLDYDTEDELKKKYSVSIQHTLVQVDSQGNQITKWVGGNDLASVIKRLK